MTKPTYDFARRPRVCRSGLGLVAALCLLGCGAGTTIDEYPCPDEGTELTYDNFGESFLVAYCQRCHGAPLGSRNGAPTEYDFATLDDVHEWQDRIFARAAADNSSMPPGPDDPSLRERVMLADWLACGAP